MANNPFLDALSRRIAAPPAAPAEPRDADAWRTEIAALKARTGASDAELARALRDVVQGRAPDARLDDGNLRGLAHFLFIVTAESAPDALVAVPKLLGRAEAGAATLDAVLDFAARTLQTPAI